MDPNVYVIFGAAVLADGSPSGTLRRRIEGAWAFAQRRGGDAIFILSGALGDHPPSEAEVMRRHLLALGANEQQLIKEDSSTDTLENVVHCAAIIRNLNAYQHLYVCTSPYHSWRCQLLFYLYGFRCSRAQMPGDLRPLGWAKWLMYCSKECLATPWDVLLILLRRARQPI